MLKEVGSIKKKGRGREVEGHRRCNRAKHRHGRLNPNDEFQVDTSTRLGEMFSYMKNMSHTWDIHWVEQQ